MLIESSGRSWQDAADRSQQGTTRRSARTGSGNDPVGLGGVEALRSSIRPEAKGVHQPEMFRQMSRHAEVSHVRDSRGAGGASDRLLAQATALGEPVEQLVER